MLDRAKLIDVVYSIVRSYPSHLPLSPKRVTLSVFLADWKHALMTGRPVTGIKWQHEAEGPDSPAVFNVMKEPPELFSLTYDHREPGRGLNSVELVDPDHKPDLSGTELQVLDHIAEETVDLSWVKFRDLVNSAHAKESVERARSFACA